MDPHYNSPHWWPKKSIVSPPRTTQGTKITILGCGTSTGVPLLACRCLTCRSRDPRNKRMRASILIQVKNKVFLIDLSPDLRTQALNNQIHWVDAVLITHPHADHLHGIDELRSLNFLMARRIPVYGNSWTKKVLRHRFDYIFSKTQQGGGKPMIDLHLITKKQKIAGVFVQPLELRHGKLPVLGFRINDIAYLTDCSYIPEHTFRYLKNLEVLILDCLRPQAHSTHLTVEQSLALAQKIAAKRTYFTHMGHEIEYRKFLRHLPRSMAPAYDGLTIRAY